MPLKISILIFWLPPLETTVFCWRSPVSRPHQYYVKSSLKLEPLKRLHDCLHLFWCDYVSLWSRGRSTDYRSTTGFYALPLVKFQHPVNIVSYLYHVALAFWCTHETDVFCLDLLVQHALSGHSGRCLLTDLNLFPCTLCLDLRASLKWWYSFLEKGLKLRTIQNQNKKW